MSHAPPHHSPFRAPKYHQLLYHQPLIYYPLLRSLSPVRLLKGWFAKVAQKTGDLKTQCSNLLLPRTLLASPFLCQTLLLCPSQHTWVSYSALPTAGSTPRPSPLAVLPHWPSLQTNKQTNKNPAQTWAVGVQGERQ